MKFRVLLPLLMMPLTAGCTQPAGMYQEARVLIVDGQACFGVANNKESRNTPPVLTAVSVDRFTGTDWENVWSWITPETPAVTLRPEQCIGFGRPLIPAGASKLAGPLRTGERYNITINSQIPNPRHRGDRMIGRAYTRDFCLQASSDGSLRAIAVPTTAGKTQWRVCESGP